MEQYNTISTCDNLDDGPILLDKLRAKLPRALREQLTLENQSRAYFLLRMLSDDPCVQQLHTSLQEKYQVPLPSLTPIEQALALVTELQENACDDTAPFKFRLPHFLSEYPIHSKEVNSKINQFNALIETYYDDELFQSLDASALEKAYKDILNTIKIHYMGCNIYSLWELLTAMSSWSTSPIGDLLANFPYLLLPIVRTTEKSVYAPLPPFPTSPVEKMREAILENKPADTQPFISTFDYKINEAGEIDKSTYLLINGFALKPGGHADALAKNIPQFLPWKQWQSYIRRQLSQLIDLPLNDDFFDWLQIGLERLGIEFMTQKTSFNESDECCVSPFLNPKTILNTLNEDMVFEILQDSCNQASFRLETSYLPIISRYLMRFLQHFQYNRGQALGIGANWGGVVSDSNEAGADAFRINDAQWAFNFRHLSAHRQGPAEAYMNATIGVLYEFQALLSSFEYMTQLQPSEYGDTLYNALVDHLVTDLFPEPSYFENETYIKYRRHNVVKLTDDGMQHIEFFYQQDPQGTYFKAKKGDYKQTPMFRHAGSLVVEPFPRDIGSGDCFQSLSVANPLWPLQLQYAQCSSTSMRGHIVYNPIGPDEFLPDAFYGQIIREADEVLIPFIGVIPKNFDKHFNQVELCASFVIRMLQSSRLMTYCPAFIAYYFAIATRFLPAMDRFTPVLPSHVNLEIQRKWQALDNAVHDQNRSAPICNQVFFSLFKELIYSLYALTKEDHDLHYYFVKLTTSSDAFESKSRATCERLIRELTTLKPLYNLNILPYYDSILQYLGELTNFFYPNPCDATAKIIAQQARLHVTTLLALPEIKAYFSDLSQKYTMANLSRKVSPGLMHDALKYQRPSPNVWEDFFSRRHATNFPSGYRDLDGNQMVSPTDRELFLDKVIKTVGAVLTLIHRNKTLLSLLTQPFSQAFIAGYQAYFTQKEYKILQSILYGMRGFVYGIGLGIYYTLTSIPRAIYTGWFHFEKPQPQASHVLAISSAPSNQPGICVDTMMLIRDHLLKIMALGNNNDPSIDELATLLLAQVKKINPSLFAKHKTKEAHFKQILLETFPLNSSAWKGLFEPVITVENNKTFQDMIHQYAVQIDSVFIYALYECLTAADAEKDPKRVLQTVIDKYKLKKPQDKTLALFMNYYASNPEAKRRDLVQYRFQGTALMKLKEKEKGLRKIQIWISNALDIQWGLEALLTGFIDQYRIQLNQYTLVHIVAELPDSMKEVLHEILSNFGHEKQILHEYVLDKSQKEFLLETAACYNTINSPSIKAKILEQLHINARADSSLSVKAHEHLKLTQFKQRQWRHQFIPMTSAQSIIDAIKKQMTPSQHPEVDALTTFYKSGLENPKNLQAFDAFYATAVHIQFKHGIDSPLHEWVNVTMNVLVNLLLDELALNNSELFLSPLKHSQAAMQWLSHLTMHQHGVRSLLAQFIEQANSFDEAAWRCQHILHVLEALQPEKEYIRGTGMQKLLRLICQNNNAIITSTGQEKAKKVPISALCRHSFTMQRALNRVKEKIPPEDFIRPITVPTAL